MNKPLIFSLLFVVLILFLQGCISAEPKITSDQPNFTSKLNNSIVLPSQSLIISNTPTTTVQMGIPSFIKKKSPSPDVEDSTLRIWEKEIFELTNLNRNDAKVQPLSWDENLSIVARNYSQTMAKNNFFSHNDTENHQVDDRLELSDVYYFFIAGENLAKYPLYDWDGAQIMEFSNVSNSITTGWMNSPGHRENILEKGYSDLGVGGALSEDGYLYFTQVFIRKSVCGYKNGPCCSGYSATCNFIGLTCNSNRICVNYPKEEAKVGDFGSYGILDLPPESMLFREGVTELGHEKISTNMIWFLSSEIIELHVMSYSKYTDFQISSTASIPVISGKNGTYTINTAGPETGFLIYNPDPNKKVKLFYGLGYGDHMELIDEVKLKAGFNSS